MPVKFSGDMVKQACEKAKAADDVDAAFLAPATRRAVVRVLRELTKRDNAELSGQLMAGRTVYQADLAGSSAIERIEPDGRHTLGRFENRRFVTGERVRRG